MSDRQLATTTLATIRLVRLIRDDKITEPARDRVTMIALTSDSPTSRAAASWILDMLRCPWCVTVWAALCAVGLRSCGKCAGRRVLVALAAAELAGRALSSPCDRSNL